MMFFLSRQSRRRYVDFDGYLLGLTSLKIPTPGCYLLCGSEALLLSDFLVRLLLDTGEREKESIRQRRGDFIAVIIFMY